MSEPTPAPLPTNPVMDDFRQRYLDYKKLVDQRLGTVLERTRPRSLYEPISYVLNGGGKRIRAILVMLAAEAVGGAGTDVVDAGVAIEILHNFTLVHDDIMDRASIRRGRATVHSRWDEGVAILAGDAMIGVAHQVLLNDPPVRLVEVMRAVTQGIIDVCEGQSMDRDYETQRDVSIEEYLAMIAMKTGRLVETAAEVGGLVGNGSDREIDGLRAYARHIGTAFQIQDDLLDIVAEEAEFGKRIGGDIIEGKKTYLLIKANERVAEGPDRELLDRFLSEAGLPEQEVDAMRDIYRRHGILDEARSDVQQYIEMSEEALMSLPDTPARTMLVWFAQMLLNRST